MQEVRAIRSVIAQLETSQSHLRDNLAGELIEELGSRQAAALDGLQRQTQGLADRGSATWEVLQMLVQDRNQPSVDDEDSDY